MILLAFWAAGGPGRRAGFFEPTYPIYALHTRTTQTEVNRVVLADDDDVGARGLDDPVDLLLLVSPNNPTGNLLDRGLIREALKRRCLVFGDEAYGDYADETAAYLGAEHPNLLVRAHLTARRSDGAAGAGAGSWRPCSALRGPAERPVARPDGARWPGPARGLSRPRRGSWQATGRQILPRG